MANYKLTQTGPEVQDLLNRIQDAKIEEGTITIGGVSITPLTEETDPTVPSWAKQPSKPTYTAEEVGALPASSLELSQIPTDGSYTRSEFERTYCSVSELLKVVDGLYRFASVDYDNGASVIRREMPVCGGSTDTMGVTDCTVSILDGTVAVNISFNRDDGDIIVSTVAVTAYDIAEWDAKYDKPAGGIPKTDLASAVQASLDKADNAVRFNASQDLTTAQKLTARRNISALGEEDAQMVYRGYQTEPGFEGKEGDIYISDGEFISISPTYTEGWGRWYMIRTYNVLPFSNAYRIKVTNIRLGPFGGSIRYVDANDNTIVVDIDDSEFFCPIGTKTVSLTADESESYPSADFYQEISPSSLKEYHDGGWVNHVPFSGSYNDLTDKPSIPAAQVNSDWNANSGVAQILNKPAIPDAVVANPTVPSGTTPTDLENLKIGSSYYSIPQGGSQITVDSALSDTSENPVQNKVVKGAIDAKQDTIDATHKLDYAYLSNTPTIPTVPTNVSAFTNDAGYLTAHQDITGKADKVSGATADNFAGLDANGNLKDSGKKASDFATAAQGAKADTAYQKPSSGIPSTDLASGVIPDVSGFYTKPSGGIPASDIASGVIPDAVEANPTVPSGTTPTAMTGMKIGSAYYSVAASVSPMSNNDIDNAVNSAWV